MTTKTLKQKTFSMMTVMILYMNDNMNQLGKQALCFQVIQNNV